MISRTLVRIPIRVPIRIPIRIPIWTGTVPASGVLSRTSTLSTDIRFLATAPTPAAITQCNPQTPSPKASHRQEHVPIKLPYSVERTASNNLAVYNEARARGTKKQTVIRRIVGDTRALKQDLLAELNFPTDTVIVNPVTNHIRIKGFHAQKVKDWLTSRSC